MIYIILCIAILYGGYKWYLKNKEAEQTNALLQETIKTIVNDLDNKIKQNQKDSIRSAEKMDSAASVYKALEAKRKSENAYYQNKLNGLKKINTYSARQRYADSLARSMR